MTGSSVDTAPYGSAVRGLLNASRGSYHGPAVTEPTLQSALGSICLLYTSPSPRYYFLSLIPPSS